MLNKDKVEETTHLDAVKSDRSLYIPRAVIKRPVLEHVMPIGARINDEVATDRVLFFIILNSKHATANAYRLDWIIRRMKIENWKMVNQRLE